MFRLAHWHPPIWDPADSSQGAGQGGTLWAWASLHTVWAVQDG